MKKALISFALVIIAGGSFYVYNNWFSADRPTLWSLVPGSAVLVFENSNLLKTWESIRQKPTWQNLEVIKDVRDLNDQFTRIDTLVGAGYLETILSDNPVLISLHVTSSNKFDYLFQLEIKSIEHHTAVWQALEKFENLGFEQLTRNYQGYSLTEISGDDLLFTYIFYQNYFIGSFTPFLVEDVIRTLDRSSSNAFYDQHNSLFTLVRLQNDEGNFYINVDLLDDFLGLFTDDRKFKTDLTNSSGSTFFDVSIEDKNILLNGFTLLDSSSTFLSTFHSNSPSLFELADHIPTNTAILHHFSFNDGMRWDDLKEVYWQKTAPDIGRRRSGLKKNLDIDVKQYFDWIGNELALALLESQDVDNPNKLVFVKSSDIDRANRQLTELANRSLPQGDSLYYENYQGIRITQVNFEEFPELLFGSLFDQFERTFVTMVNQSVILSNDINALKKWYDDYLNDNTWGKSVKKIQFLDATLKEANYSIFLETNRAWNTIKNYLSDDWAHFIEENSGVIRRFEMAALQFSYVEDKYYTSLVLNQPEDDTNGSGRYAEKVIIDFASPLVSKPAIVRNHNNRQFETLLQDSLNNIYLVNANGEVLWTDSIAHKIISDVFQIDFYKNGKLQYLFAGDQHLYVIDRNGDPVAPYPLQIFEEQKIEFLSLVDYDNSKRYRFMVVDENGNIYLYDKNGKNLQGWTPRTLDGPLTSPAEHQRIRTRDRMVAIQKVGVVNVISRTGQMSRGFPIDLKADTESSGFITIGSSFGKSELTTITNDGEIVSMNLEGQILKRNQLYKPNPETTFTDIPDALGVSHLFVRRDENRLAVLNLEGEVLFEKDYLSSNDLEWQYYNFGGGNEIIIVLDKEQEFAYLYDRRGQLINYQPVSASHKIALLYFASENIFRLYKTYQNQFSILEFTL